MKHGGSCSANQVNPDPMCLTSFVDDSTERLALSCSRDDALVDKSAAAPKPSLLLVGMRMLTAADGLLPTGTASTAMRTIIPRPLFSRSLGETRKCTNRTNNQLASLCRWGDIRTKSRQTLMFDPGRVLNVVYSPACIWEGGARCFVGRFSFERRMVPGPGVFFWQKDDFE